MTMGHQEVYTVSLTRNGVFVGLLQYLKRSDRNLVPTFRALVCADLT